MPRTRPPYSLEFRQRMVELVKTGRTPEELSREFEPTAQTIHNWVKQSDLDTGVRSDGLTSSELEELRGLRRENKRLRIEREILKKPRPGSLRRPTRCPRGVRVRDGQPGGVMSIPVRSSAWATTACTGSSTVDIGAASIRSAPRRSSVPPVPAPSSWTKKLYGLIHGPRRGRPQKGSP